MPPIKHGERCVWIERACQPCQPQTDIGVQRGVLHILPARPHPPHWRFRLASHACGMSFVRRAPHVWLVSISVSVPRPADQPDRAGPDEDDPPHAIGHCTWQSRRTHFNPSHPLGAASVLRCVRYSNRAAAPHLEYNELRAFFIRLACDRRGFLGHSGRPRRTASSGASRPAASPARTPLP
jgi:hypothetical protein